MSGTAAPPVQGCELCGDFPVQLVGRCHPTAPLRVMLSSAHELELRCYIPACDRLVGKLVATAAGWVPA